jgi:protein disulfide-isomerase A6
MVFSDHASITVVHLTFQAGRSPEFDSLASKFFVATGAARDAVYKEAVSLAAQVGPAANHYLRVMEKVVNGGEDYISKESKRYVYLPCFATATI